MSTKKLGSVLGKTALFASVVSVSLLTAVSISLLATTTSASPIAPGLDRFTLNDPLGAVSYPPLASDLADTISETPNQKWRR